MTDTAMTVRSRYEQLVPLREPYLRRARDCAALTIPWMVLPTDNHNGMDLGKPFQSVGARGVNHLGSALLLSLFPPNESFFQYKVEPYLLDKLGAPVREEVESNLRKAEDAMLSEMESSGFRAHANEALRHLVLAGNCCIYWPSANNRMRVYHIDEYVVVRDSGGEWCELITRECLQPASLDPVTYAHWMSMRPNDTSAEAKAVGATEDLAEIYTHVKRTEDGKRYRVQKELCGCMIPGTEASYLVDEVPYIPIRGNVVSGEPYARSHTEDYLGDLQSLEGLSQSIVEAAAAAARILFAVNPAGQTDIEELAGKPNGAYFPGLPEDVKAVQLDKFADMQIAAKSAEALEQRLSLAFLLNTAVQRNGERVTATEIRWVAQELERGLGGMYSLLSQEFQLPIVRLLERRMTSAGKLPKIPKDLVTPSIVAGIEALGRGTDADKLESALTALSTILTPPVLAQYLNPGVTILRYLNAKGLRDDGMIRKADEVAQQNSALQMQQMVHKLGPEVIRQMAQQGQQGNTPQTPR